jgi:uncharacterized membrane protein YraQ (UPF0718 family)
MMRAIEILLFDGLRNSLGFTIEILWILPPILLLFGLFETWMPGDAIDNYLGVKSGAKGMLAALLLGSAAAGPLFTAFPLAVSMHNKGGRTANIVIFLGSWATIKLPMLIMESRFLGLRFSILRLVLTVPLIVLTGLVMEKFEFRRSSID